MPFAADFKRHGDSVKFAKEYIPTLRSWSEATFLNGLSDRRSPDEQRKILDDFYGKYQCLWRIARGPWYGLRSLLSDYQKRLLKIKHHQIFLTELKMLPQQPLITGRRHMVVAGHYLATEAGLKILEAGGNAVDAGVAAGIALGVLHSDQVQFSGVAPMLIYIKKLNKVISVAGLGHWPKAANLEFFEKNMAGKYHSASIEP